MITYIGAIFRYFLIVVIPLLALFGLWWFVGWIVDKFMLPTNKAKAKAEVTAKTENAD